MENGYQGALMAPTEILAAFVRAGDGSMVQLDNLAKVSETVAAKELNHFNKLRSATITATLAPGYVLGDALAFLQAFEHLGAHLVVDADAHAARLRLAVAGRHQHQQAHAAQVLVPAGERGGICQRCGAVTERSPGALAGLPNELGRG